MSDTTREKVLSILFIVRDDLGEPIDPPRALIFGQEPRLLKMTADRNGWLLEVSDE